MSAKENIAFGGGGGGGGDLAPPSYGPGMFGGAPAAG